MANVWTWIKAHSLWLFAGALGLIAGYYLIFRPGSSSGSGATTVSYPASGGGGGGGQSGGGGTATTGPYSPDFGILGSITDSVLRGLWERALNLQTQINAATIAGNTALVNSLQTALDLVMGQIDEYGKTPGAGAAPSLPAGFAEGFLQSYTAWIARLTGSQSGLAYEQIPVADRLRFFTEFFGSLGVPVAYANYLFARLHNYEIATGLQATTAQIQEWLREAYNGASIPDLAPDPTAPVTPPPGATASPVPPAGTFNGSGKIPGITRRMTI